jgi:hypothetical protein
VQFSLNVAFSVEIKWCYGNKRKWIIATYFSESRGQTAITAKITEHSMRSLTSSALAAVVLLSSVGYITSAAAADAAAFGQPSVAISPHSDRRALPRFPIAEAFADFRKFRSKAASRALPLIDFEPDPGIAAPRPQPSLRAPSSEPGRCTGSVHRGCGYLKTDGR